MIYTDIPTPRELERLIDLRAEQCVSVYFPTHAVTSEGAEDRIVYKNLVKEAGVQMHDGSVDKRVGSSVVEELDSLIDDEELWQHLSDSLAVFATPESLRTYRLHVPLQAQVQVSDRFHLKPLLAAMSASSGYYILAIALGSVKLIEVTSNKALEIKVPDLPKDISHAVKRNLPKDPAPAGRIQGGEGDKVLLRQYCRMVDRAIRPVIARGSHPLVLACVDHVGHVYRGVSSYAHIGDEFVSGNPEHLSADQLRVAAELIVAHMAAAPLHSASERFAQLRGTGKAIADIETLGPAATGGLIDTLIVQLGAPVYGTLDTMSGEVTIAEAPGADTYDVLDKIASLTIKFGGTVFAVEKDEMPADGHVAAILRYAI
ncbi:MAG: hypothetical protein ACR2OR_06450 [Hyphomicrobiales bacterium]